MKIGGRVCAQILAVALSAQICQAAGPWINMGIKDDAAFSQPVVKIELFHQLSNGTAGSSIGPDNIVIEDIVLFETNSFILDTGATSIIAMNSAVDSLEENGYTTINQVMETGVAGSEPMDVSATYFAKITDNLGGVTSLPHTRILSGQFPDLFTVNGIVGMPAMVGKVVTLDNSHWADLELEGDDIEDILDLFLQLNQKVSIGNTLPAANGHRYSVPIRAQEFPLTFDPEICAPSICSPDPAKQPSASPLAFVDMSIGADNLQTTGDFILDTGASLTFISPTMAAAIGLDSDGNGEFDEFDDRYFDTVEVGGIGGIHPAPQFLIDRISLMTEQGVELVWEGEQATTVLIVDIHPDIAGVLGSDILTSGWLRLTEVNGEPEFEFGDGPLLGSHFDFRNFFQTGDTGKIYFDLNPVRDLVIPGGTPGDLNGDGNFDALDYVLWAINGGTQDEYLAWKENYNAVGQSISSPGDLNGDGVFNALDYVLWGIEGRDPAKYADWASNYNAGQSGSGTGSLVPEPNTAILISIAAAVIAQARRRATRPARFVA